MKRAFDIFALKGKSSENSRKEALNKSIDKDGGLGAVQNDAKRFKKYVCNK
jgi:hypothetical protein